MLDGRTESTHRRGHQEHRDDATGGERRSPVSDAISSPIRG